MPDNSRACRLQPRPAAAHPLCHALGAGAWQPCLAVLAATAVTKELACALAVQRNCCVISTHISKFPKVYWPLISKKQSI